jgi:hypothetical protein
VVEGLIWPWASTHKSRNAHGLSDVRITRAMFS